MSSLSGSYRSPPLSGSLSDFAGTFQFGDAEFEGEFRHPDCATVLKLAAKLMSTLLIFVVGQSYLNVYLSIRSIQVLRETDR